MRCLLVSLSLLLLGAGLGGCQGGGLGRKFRVPDMRVEGNKTVDDDDLVAASERYLRRFVEHDRRPADADDAAYAMEVSLREQGYPEARVDFNLEPGGDLIFTVEEGPKVHLGCVRFEGVGRIPIADLEPYFDFEGTGFLWLGPRVVDPERLATAASSVEAHYRREGFIDVRVEEPELDWNAARTCADVVVRVEEGKRYTVSDVVVTGAAGSRPDLQGIVGRPFRPHLQHQLAASLRRQLRNRAFAFATVDAKREIDTDRAEVRVRLEGDPGQRTYVRRLRFEGNRKVRTAFLRNRFRLQRGGLLQRNLLEQGIADLYRSRLFASVESRVKETGPGCADVEIKVEEGNSKRLDVSGGWGSWDQLWAGVSFIDYNVFGMGRIFRASSFVSMKSLGGEVELEDPWILGVDNRVWIRLGALQREEPFYDYTGFHVELGVERRFDRRNRLEGGYKFALEEATDLDAAIPPAELEKIDDFQRSSGLYLLYRHDGRDDRFLPTSGLFADGGVLFSAPLFGASLSYLQLEARLAYHFDLGNWGVLAAGGFAGTRQPYGDTVMPIQRRYFLGGQASVRSFGLDELTPTDPFGNGIGGLTAIEGHVEWRKQIYDVLHGALFFDAGQVSLEPFSVDGGVGYGVGAGLRAYTPVGPVRLDLGYNPGPLFAASKRWHLHFSFGFSF